MTSTTDIPNTIYRNALTVGLSVIVGLLTIIVAVIGFAAKDAHSENRERVQEIQILREERLKRTEFEAVVAKLDERIGRVQSDGTQTRSVLDVFMGEMTTMVRIMAEDVKEIKEVVKPEGARR